MFSKHLHLGRSDFLIFLVKSTLNLKCTLKGNCYGDCASAVHFSEFSSLGASASTGCPRNAALGSSGAAVLGG